MLSKLIEAGYTNISHERTIAGMAFYEATNRRGDYTHFIENVSTGETVKSEHYGDDLWSGWYEVDMNEEIRVVKEDSQ